MRRIIKLINSNLNIPVEQQLKYLKENGMKKSYRMLLERNSPDRADNSSFSKTSKTPRFRRFQFSSWFLEDAANSSYISTRKSFRVSMNVIFETYPYPTLIMTKEIGTPFLLYSNIHISECSICICNIHFILEKNHKL